MIQPRQEKPSPLPVDITPMQTYHLPEVYAIEVSAYPRPWPFKCFMDELTRNKVAHYFVALHGAKIVGYAGMWVVMDEGHITNVAVSYGYRRRKVAEQLLVYLLDFSIQCGVKTAFLEVRRYNLPAQLLYTRYSFEPIQVRERYYADNDEDAIVLRVADLRAPKFTDVFDRNKARLLQSLRHATPEDIFED